MAQDPFMSTQWSMVLQARDASSVRARHALEELARAYWTPLHAYVRRRGYRPQEAEDLVQGFFLHFIEKEYLRSVSAEKGRFRAFLLACLKHFLADERDRSHALKRGGGRQDVSLAHLPQDLPAALPNISDDLDDAYHRDWAVAVLAEALRRVAEKYEREGKTPLFQALYPRLSGDESKTYDELSQALSLEIGAVRTAVHRLRRRYRASLEAVVLETVEDGRSLKDELRVLFAAVGRAHAPL